MSVAIWSLSSIVNDESIIAAGPLFKQTSTVPYRVVLRQVLPVGGECQYVVHDQHFLKREHGKGEYIFSYVSGTYFTDLGQAMERFAQRVSRQANYTECIELM